MEYTTLTGLCQIKFVAKWINWSEHRSIASKTKNDLCCGLFFFNSFLGATSKQLGCPPIITGGVEDHVHQLARLSRTITQAEWIKELRVSSLWLKNECLIRNFEWQGGYGAFSVSASHLGRVREYIRNQEKHHEKVSFQDELRSLMREYGIEWDERYIWQ